MVEAGVAIDTIHEDGSTLFYLAIQNAEWGVAEYLLDVGADPKIFPIRDRPTFWSLELDDFCSDQPFSQPVEKRIECFQRLHESGVLKSGDKKFTKRLLFVGQCDTKDVIESVIERLPENLIIRIDALLQQCCANDWINVYAMVIRKRRKVTFDEFRIAFRDGSLEFIQMLCYGGIESIRRFEAFPTVTVQASYFLETLISPFRNDEKIGFIQHFIKKHNFKGCCQALFQVAAVYGCSDLVEKCLQIFYVDNVRDSINDDLIDGMFRQCARGGIKEEIDPYSDYINTLKLLLTAATRKNNEIIEVDEIFKSDDVKLIARMILQDRTDVVEQMIFNHVYAFMDRVANYLGVSLACSAVSCSDCRIVESLIEQGWDFKNSVYCRCRLNTNSPRSPLVCGLENLLDMKRKNVKTTNGQKNELESLKYIEKVVNNRCYIADDSSRFDPTIKNDHHRCLEDKYVLDAILLHTDNNYSIGFKLELLKIVFSIFDFDLNEPSYPDTKMSIYDFFVPDQMVESGMFCLFQAGASAEFIRSFSLKFQERTKQEHRLRYTRDYINDAFHVHEIYPVYPDYPYNANLCKALVSDRDKTVWLTLCSDQIFEDFRTWGYRQRTHSSELHRSPVFEQLIEEFLVWYRHATSSLSTLQSQCRTVTRKTLILASGHRSILKRIELLHLPEKLKKFLIYE